MFRLWGKLYKDNKIIQDTVISKEDSSVGLEKLIDLSLEEICMIFDLQKPIWLSDSHKDIKQFNRVLFRKDHFIEEIEFDYLEIEIIEQDK